jgi:hypothetical protein
VPGAVLWHVGQGLTGSRGRRRSSRWPLAQRGKGHGQGGGWRGSPRMTVDGEAEWQLGAVARGGVLVGEGVSGDIDKLWEL